MTNSTNSKDTLKKGEQTPELPQDDNKEASQKSVIKKDRLKFKKEDMYEIKYNF